METILLYVIKAAVCLAILYIPYIFLLRHETFYRLNRYILVGIAIVSLIIPLLHISNPAFIQQWFEAKNAAEVTVQVENDIATSNYIAETDVTPIADSSFSITTILACIYLLGVVAMLIINIVIVSRLYHSIFKGVLWKQKVMGVNIYCHIGNKTSFSWLNNIVISEADYQNNADAILTHENAHISHYHSYENILIEICKIVQWFNPFAWLLADSLRDVQEFEADETVLQKGVNAQQYQSLLLMKAVGPRLHALANTFRSTNLKKRFIMMNKQQSRPMACLRYLVLLPLLVFSVISCSQKKATETAETADATPHEIMCTGTVLDAEFGDPLVGAAVIIKGTAKGTITDLDGVFHLPMMSDQTLSIVFVDYEKQEVAAAENVTVKLKRADPNSLGGVTVSQESVEFSNGTPTNSEAAQETPESVTVTDEDGSKEVFTVVEEMASFPGKNSEAELMAFLVKNLHYPASCAEKGIEGRVVVKFLVQPDGTLTDFEAVNSPDEELSAAAIEVCKKMPKWNPAKQRGNAVKSYFTVPITFRLNK